MNVIRLTSVAIKIDSILFFTEGPKMLLKRFKRRKIKDIVNSFLILRNDKVSDHLSNFQMYLI